MTTYAKIITLSDDTKWIALSNTLAWLKKHDDKDVREAGKNLQKLLGEEVEMVQMSGSSVDKNGNYKVWIG